METALVLVLIYSGATMVIEPRDDLKACAKEAHDRLGEQLNVTFWDDMGGSNPIPVVVAAFCAPGAVKEEDK